MYTGRVQNLRSRKNKFFGGGSGAILENSEANEYKERGKHKAVCHGVFRQG